MKVKELVFVFLLIFIITGSIEARNKILDDDQMLIKSVVLDFVMNIDSGNVDGLKKCLTEKSTYTLSNSILNKTNEYSYDDFLDAIKKQQIGGLKRSYEIMNIDLQGGIAMVRIDSRELKTTQTGYVALLKENNDWRIITSVFMLEKNK